MEALTEFGSWCASSFLQLWNAIGTWGIIGVGIIAPAVLKKIANLLKKIFQF